MSRPLLPACLWALILALPAVSSAQAPPDAKGACNDTVEVDRFRLLRQLTLDLWGRAPSEDELRTLVSGEVDEARVDTMLASNEFDRFVERHHADLLWPSVNGLDFVPIAGLLLPTAQYGDGGDGNRLFNIFIALYQRRELYAACKDEPAVFDEDGEPVFEDMVDGTRREGYVFVEPYWAPGTQIKVCAAEASVRPTNEYGDGCASFQGMYSGQCGCGPNLEHCADLSVAQTLLPMLREQLMRMVRGPIDGNRPYTEVLTTVEEELNGPLAHYYRHLAPLAIDPIVLVPPVAPAELAELPYTDFAWRTFRRTPELHSGVLTSLAYMLRFQTARARANRYSNAFLCEPFQAPVEGLPIPNDECSQEPNLSERCGCNYCHSKLEPAAAHWGRFAEAGTLYLDPQVYPVFDSRCAACAENPQRECGFICDRFYVTDIGHPKEAQYAGVLKAYEWRTREQIARMELGPKALVEDAITDGRLASCSTVQLFRRLYKREPTEAEVNGELLELSRAFQAGGFNFKSLVKSLVQSPGYRRLVR